MLRFRCAENEPGPGNQLAPERNPMLNPVVLKRLFDFCKLKDLFGYRLVSKEWYSSSLPRIRNEATVQINNSNLKRADDLNWTTFNKNFRVAGKQFKSFKLAHVDFFDSPVPSKLPASSGQNYVLKGRAVNIEKMYKNMEKFWGQCGPFINSLELGCSTVYSVAAFKKAIFDDMPNLEKLALLDDVETWDEDYVPQDKGVEDQVVNVNSNLKHLTCRFKGHFLISWSVLFDHFPNIETLELSCHDSGPGNAIAALVTKLKSQDEIALKVLKIRDITEQQCEPVWCLLQLPKLKLSKFHIGFRGFSEEEEDEDNVKIRRTVKTALRFQGDHLGSLLVNANDVIFEYDESEPLNNFPFRREPLQNLTCLEFSATVPNFYFLQQTPNLKYLRMLYDEDVKILDEADMEILGTTTLPFLSEFYFYRRLISEKEMQGFVKIMPNVERFHAFIDAGAFRVVCENWRQLRDLVVDDIWNSRLFLEVDYVGDEAITGVVDGCEERRPNICDLHCLENLKIMFTDKIGDASIWNGFLQLPKLSTLEIFISPKTSSDEAYAALVTRFPEGKVIRRERHRGRCGC